MLATATQSLVPGLQVGLAEPVGLPESVGLLESEGFPESVGLPELVGWLEGALLEVGGGRLPSQTHSVEAAASTEFNSPSFVQVPRTQPKAACWMAEDEAGMHWQDRSLVLVQPTWLAAEVMHAEAHEGMALVRVVHGSVPVGAVGEPLVTGELVTGDEDGAAEEGAAEEGAAEVDGAEEAGVRVASQAQSVEAAARTEFSSPSFVQAPRTQPKAAC